MSAAGLAACITLLFLGMRAVMDIGGACASGGPFVSVRPCPDGIAALMTVGTLGLFVFGGLGIWAGARVGGGWAALPFLAWPGLFLSLGWNFLEYGIRPPGDEPGPSIGWLFCGVVFVLMGAVPLWIAISARNELREEGGRSVVSRYFPPRTADGRLAARGARPGRLARIADEADLDLVAKIERLADLHRRRRHHDRGIRGSQAPPPGGRPMRPAWLPVAVLVAIVLGIVAAAWLFGVIAAGRLTAGMERFDLPPTTTI